MKPERMILAIVLGLFAVGGWIIFRSTDEVVGKASDASDARTVLNGFDVTDALIPAQRIASGGPPRDGIPALASPRFVSAADATYLQPDDRVIGVHVSGQARAYPLRILVWHEVVNDVVGDRPVLIVYCPLCDSATVFDRAVEGKAVEFGVSGLLFNSNVLIYDRSPNGESLWTQINGLAVTGPAQGTRLQALPFRLTSWAHWLGEFPETTALSDATAHRQRYQQSPYSDYFKRDRLMFPVEPFDADRLPAKQRVLGVWSGESSRAYPVTASLTRMEDAIDGKRIVVRYIPGADTLVVDEAEEDIEWAYSFWFAWYAFRPDTEVWEAAGTQSAP